MQIEQSRKQLLAVDEENKKLIAELRVQLE